MSAFGEPDHIEGGRGSEDGTSSLPLEQDHEAPRAVQIMRGNSGPDSSEGGARDSSGDRRVFRSLRQISHNKNQSATKVYKTRHESEEQIIRCDSQNVT